MRWGPEHGKKGVLTASAVSRDKRTWKRFQFWKRSQGHIFTPFYLSVWIVVIFSDLFKFYLYHVSYAVTSCHCSFFSCLGVEFDYFSSVLCFPYPVDTFKLVFYLSLVSIAVSQNFFWSLSFCCLFSLIPSNGAVHLCVPDCMTANSRDPSVALLVLGWMNCLQKVLELLHGWSCARPPGLHLSRL